MSQTEAPIEVLGVSDIARRLGVSRQAAYETTLRSDFPEPFAIVTSRRFYLPEEVDAYIAARQSKSHNGGDH